MENIFIGTDPLEYRADGTLKRINMASEGPFNEMDE